MANWLTMVIALTCLGGLVGSPVPSVHKKALKELIGELDSITSSKVPLCNGSMVWSFNLTDNVYCAALEALRNVSDCSVISNTVKKLNSSCTQHKSPANVSSMQVPDTKIELSDFMKKLLNQLKKNYHHGLIN
ncbi:interleukin-13 [Tenrec ecaudatus]|uniref:interleukin-13 n=1 Tax=Tenrec ecaudatus TaxID=94439 RepID=UPI003F591526